MYNHAFFYWLISQNSIDCAVLHDFWSILQKREITKFQKACHNGLFSAIHCTLNFWINVHVCLFFWANFHPIQALFLSVWLFRFWLFPSYTNLIWACTTIKIQQFCQQFYWRIKYRKKLCCLVWNIRAESRFYSVENALVQFKLFPFIPSAQSSWLNGIETWCLMISGLFWSSCMCIHVTDVTAMLWSLTHFHQNETKNII